jgi:hypothetical protein
VHKNIISTICRGNKTKALRIIKPLYNACLHIKQYLQKKLNKTEYAC